MRPINECFNQKLAKIYKQSLEANNLTKIIHKFLPEFLHIHCKVGSFYEGTLTILTTNSGCANQLRFLLPELRDNLRKYENLYQLTNIKVKIDNPEIKKTKKIKIKKDFSDKARTIINELAQQCEYAPLKEALIKLSRKKKTTS